MSDYNDNLLPDPCLRLDYGFGEQWNSVELGDGTGYVKSAPMLSRLGALHVELDEMRDENAKLRELARTMHGELVSCERQSVADLEAENSKLRKLVADMWTCIGEGEWDCSHYPPRYVICDDGVSEFMDRARELGVEVEE